MKNKWILLAVAIGILTINLINSDFSAFRNCQPRIFCR